MATDEPIRKRTRHYVNEVFKQLQKQVDIKDILILNSVGNPVQSTMNEQESLQHAGMYGSLLEKSKYITQLIDPEDEVLTLRIRTKSHEVLITPDEKITIIVFQNPVDRMERQKLE